MAIDTITIEQFVTDNGINMTCKRVDENPYMDESRNMDHWKCVLTRSFEGISTYTDRQTGEARKRNYTLQLTLTFSQGFGHHGEEPKTEAVLSCLASDSASIENARSFEEWAEELGYSADSRKAERTFKICQHQSARLKKFLGDGLYQTLLFGVEPY